MSEKRHMIANLALLLLASLWPSVSRPETLSGGRGATSPPAAPGATAPAASQAASPVPSEAPAASVPQASHTAVSRVYAPSLLGAYRKTMELESEIKSACDRYGVPLALARAVCMYESGGDEGLISGAGARGYFQVMPATYRLMGVSTNIEAGVKYLSQLLRQYKREDDALAAYNGGPRRLNSRRALPIETLQYVVGVGIYRTLLTREDQEIRVEASKLKLRVVGPSEDWVAISAATAIPVLELRLYNPYLALRRLKPGERLAHPVSSTGPFLYPPGDGSSPCYITRRGDNYLHLAFSLDIDLDQFRQDNTLWRVQVPLEGMRLVVRTRAEPRATTLPVAAGKRAGAPAGETAAPESASAVTASADPEAASMAPTAQEAVGAALQGKGAADTAGSPQDVGRMVVHKVRRGETLFRIASRYGVSVEAILTANQLRRSRVIAGQVLKIPVD